MSVVGSAAVDSRSPSRAASLSDDAVHLWRAHLDWAATRLHRLGGSLSKEERTRALRFHFATDRERFVASRGVLREILAHYLSTTAGCLHLRAATTGKPFVVDDRHLRFNISHTSRTMLLAVAREREIGVDIEQLDADVAIAELAETTLSMPERRVLDRLDGESGRAAFLAFWTRKEALVKADGRGLSLLRLSDIDVSGPGGLVALWDEKMGSWTRSTRWLIRAPALDAAHVAAVAAEGRDWHIACRRWPEDLAGLPPKSHGGG